MKGKNLEFYCLISAIASLALFIIDFNTYIPNLFYVLGLVFWGLGILFILMMMIKRPRKINWKLLIPAIILLLIPILFILFHSIIWYPDPRG